MQRSSGSFRSLTLFLVAAAFHVLATAASEVTVTAAGEETSQLLPRAASKAVKHRSDKVHGILMGVTVIILFPMGSICWRVLDRLVSGRWLLRIHVGCQLLGLAMLICGFGTGVWVCILHNEVYNDEWGHVYLGTFVTALFLLQPITGQLHHILYKSASRQVKPWLRLFHMWLGRLVMAAAIINGATGIVLGNNSPGGEKGYSIAAGIVGVTYIAIVVLWYWNRGKHPVDDEKSSRDESSRERHVDVDVETK